MARLVLRQTTDEQAASAEEAGQVVAAHGASVVGHSGRNLLVDFDGDGIPDLIQAELRGWVVSVQGPGIQVPDTRLKVRSPR